ncbi:MAG TPA: Vms1/Ankzf1 family peptidyl-tRNA hydrolase [bacterium]|nr:Vms1/Ankzf1 family peptidyl-tRNA hydrolase [bacterium]
MFQDVDLRELTELQAPDRCFLSVYMSDVRDFELVERQIGNLERGLSTGSGSADERNHLAENMSCIRDHLSRQSYPSGPACIFACWLLDVLRVIPLTVPVDPLVRLDSSPYVRPLAELQDEYEDVAVVVADNNKARIYVIASAVAGDARTIHGNVKNHVKKGGWSQQRYERRRDKQLMVYAREIVERLAEIDRESSIRHVVLVGGKEIIREIIRNLPPVLQEKTTDKAVDLGRNDDAINEDIRQLFVARERQSEMDLWDRIRTEYLRGGLGVVGMEDVQKAVMTGRVDTMVVSRELKPEGRRCRECEAFLISAPETCPHCGSDSLFPVDAVEELVELVDLHGGQTDFVDPVDTLTACGGIGALLRY